MTKGLIVVEIQPGQYFRGALYFQPMRFALSPAYAAAIIAQGIGMRV
jgi:hypothetical protein